MKNTSLLILSLALLSAPAAFAATSATEIPTLPAVVVTAERTTPVERAVAASLAEFAALARHISAPSAVTAVPVISIAEKSDAKPAVAGPTVVAAKG